MALVSLYLCLIPSALSVFASLLSFLFLRHCHSLQPSLLSVRQWICLPLCLPVCSHSLDIFSFFIFFFFFGWAGSNGVRVLRNASPIIHHRLAWLLCRSLHRQAYMNTRTYTCKHSFLGNRSDFVHHLAADTLISPLFGRARVEQVSASLCLHLHGPIKLDYSEKLAYYRELENAFE